MVHYNYKAYCSNASLLPYNSYKLILLFNNIKTNHELPVIFASEYCAQVILFQEIFIAFKMSFDFKM